MKKIMSKKILWVFIVIFFAGHLLTAGLIDLYKKGVIKMINSPDYGKGADWESLFYKKVTSIAAAEDGSIFLANTFEHNIFMFSPAGQFVKTIGRRGQGPGDLDHPTGLSILDNRYLLVQEYPRNREFSLFDLQGKYIKKVKTSRYVSQPVSLSSGKIAYTCKEDPYYQGENPKINVCIMDLESGEEKIVDTIPVVKRNRVVLDSGSDKNSNTMLSRSLSFTNFIGDIYIARTKEGKLLVGLSSK
ncbi:MAG: 6-bladed beta-propeller, partial [Candidatus Aminicenantes bacterium]|nr:6-bladed beta-propeller [Candidatus Aminicenantes bacterium]